MRDRPPYPSGRPSTSFAGEAPDEFRTRVLQQQADAEQRRRQDLQDQSSTLKTPAARIRVWERLHQTHLPRDLAHGLVQVIADKTGLTTEEVHDEQRARFGPAPPAT